jgi:hypothetical protein
MSEVHGRNNRGGSKSRKPTISLGGVPTIGLRKLIQGRAIVEFLIAVVKERVFEKYGIRLEEAIQLV